MLKDPKCKGNHHGRGQLTYLHWFEEKEHGEGWSNLWSNDPSHHLLTDDPPSISFAGDLECSSARAQRFADVGPHRVETSHCCRMVGQGHNVVWWHVMDMKTKLVANFGSRLKTRLIYFRGRCLWLVLPMTAQQRIGQHPLTRIVFNYIIQSYNSRCRTRQISTIVVVYGCWIPLLRILSISFPMSCHPLA